MSRKAAPTTASAPSRPVFTLVPRRAFTPGERGAFTLIELLVVIAIISVLAAILFPVFAQARAKARQASCASNLKQIGAAILQYNQDYDEMYPMGFYDRFANSTPLSWPAIIQPYAKSHQIFACPGESGDLGKTPGTFTPEAPDGVAVSYAYNYYLGGNNEPDTGVMTSSLVVVDSPAQVVMMVDGGADPRVDPAEPDRWVARRSSTAAASGHPATVNRTSWLLAHAGSSTVAGAGGNFGAPLQRHNGMTNVLWADGHVKAAKVRSFYRLLTEPEHPRRPAGGAAKWSPCLDPESGCLP